MTNKRVMARLLSPVLVVWFAIMPYREARAVPMAIPILIAGLNSSGGVAIADLAAASLSALIGGTIVALAITPQQADAPTLRLPTTSAASDNAIKPPDAPQTVPPEKYVWIVDRGGIQADTQQSALDQFCVSWEGTGSTCGGGTCSTGSASIGNNRMSCAIDQYGLLGDATQIWRKGICPNGTTEVYDDSGAVSACTVTDARAVQADGNLDFARNGSTFVALPDKDTDKSKLPFVLQSNAFLTSGTDAHGNPQTVTLQPLSTGGSLLIVRTERTDADGQKFIDRQIVQISAVGAVTTGSEANATGQGSYVDPATGTYVITEAGATSPTQTGTDTGTGSQSITFPSDYARQGEAAAAATGIVAGLDTLHQDLTKTAEAPGDPVYDKEYTGFGDTFHGLLSWQLPGHSSECPTGSFSAFGTVYTLDAHCTLMQSHEGTIRASMVAAWSLLALFIVLRA